MVLIPDGCGMVTATGDDIASPPETSMAADAYRPCPATGGHHRVEESTGGAAELLHVEVEVEVEVSNMEDKHPGDEAVDKTGVVTTTEAASWSDLPEGVLWSVAKLLSHKEFFNFASVCSSWRSLALQCRSTLPSALPLSYCLYSRNHPPPPPLLMLQSKQDGDSWDLYSVAEKKILSSVSLPGTKNMWVCGSSPDGWLAMAEVNGDELCLFNPISNARIPLPPASTMWEPLGSIDQGRHFDSTFFVNKIVYCSATTDGLIVALCDMMSRFYYCRVGDTKWSRVEDSPVRSYDLIQCRGKVYATSSCSSLFEWDFSGSTPVFKVLVSNGELAYQGYIVESVEGELLLLNRCYVDFDDEEYVPRDSYLARDMRTNHFKVFKIEKRMAGDGVDNVRYCTKDHSTGIMNYLKFEDECEFKLVEKESIGDQIIFVGFTHSMAVPAHLFPHCKGNKIYFSDDYECRNIERADMIDTGIYDLEDGSIHYFYKDDQIDPSNSAAWIIPTLW